MDSGVIRSQYFSEGDVRGKGGDFIIIKDLILLG